MDSLDLFLKEASAIVWGPITLFFLFGVGLYLTIGLRFLPWRSIGRAFKLLWAGRSSSDKGDITPFQALMTALSATIGTGNIAGVATAIFLGGPGAIFWMWITALFGMATKYAEAVLAIKYREIDSEGRTVGGPMYYIRAGVGKHKDEDGVETDFGSGKILAFLFALFGTLASFGIGNMVQANSVAGAVQSVFGVSAEVTGLVMMVLTGIVIIGGIGRIAQVAAKLVPVMAIAYVVCAVIIILMHFSEIPAAFELIISSAFNGAAASGGFAGAAVWAAIRFGVARGVFSNEAGLGSAPIAHAAAKTNDPVQQGMIAMLGTFIDTLIICTMTALVIILTGAWTSGENGAPLSMLAFGSGLPGGEYVVTFGLIVFAFTTILGWSYYGERCAEYIFGVAAIKPYRLLWLVAIPLGAMGKLGLIWTLADVMNGLMALPNLIALVVLSPVVFKVSKEAMKR